MFFFNEVKDLNRVLKVKKMHFKRLTLFMLLQVITNNTNNYFPTRIN